MNVTLINHTRGAARLLVYTKQTRLTLGEDTRRKVTEMKTEELMIELDYIANTIPSSWEFVDYVFEITGVSRAFTHQFVRTRTGSYAQQTMRMLEMEKFKYVTGPTIEASPGAKLVYDHIMSVIQMGYDQLLTMGIPAEDARGLLPTNIETNIIAKFNLRSLSDLVIKRFSPRTQGEYREVAKRMLAEVVAVHPWAEAFLQPKIIRGIQEASCLLEIANERRLTRPEITNAHKTLDKVKSLLS